MRQRIFALLTVVVLALSATFGNIQQVYAADPALTAEGLDLLYGLLSSMGVISAMGGTDADKRTMLEQSIDRNADFIDKVHELQTDGSVVTLDDGRTGFKFGDTADYDWFLDFYDSAITALTDAISFDVPDAGTIVPSNPVDLPVNVTYPLDNTFRLYASNSPSDPATGVGSGYYVAVVDGVFYAYTLRPGGVASAHIRSGTVLASDSYIDCYFRAGTKSYPLYCDVYVYNGTDRIYVNEYLKTSADARSGFLIGTASAGYTSYGTVDLAVLAGQDIGAVALSYAPEGVIPADTWARGWSDSLSDNEDVAVVLPGEGGLTGYDDLTTTYDIEHGLIRGVDIPGWVDAGTGYTGTADPDITADWEGVANGLEGANSKLGKILAGLTALPALLGSKVIGTGNLDFSKFNDIALVDVFPFCVPFDLINSFKGFNASPIAPVWSVDLQGTPMSAGGSVEIDLTQFDTIFGIVRYFTYGLFVLGLIMATRKLIKG